MRQTTKAEVCLDEGKSTSSGPARRATRTIGCERGWLRPNFIAVCLDETEDRAQQPRNLECRLRWLPSWCLVSLLGSRREDRVPTRRGKTMAATLHRGDGHMAQKGRGIFMVYVDIDAQHRSEERRVG